jgi:hypothetical protein
MDLSPAISAGRFNQFKTDDPDTAHPKRERKREGLAMTAKVAKNSNRGSRPGERRGGRTKGTPNKRTAEVEAAIKSTGMTPLEYLTSVYQDVNQDEAKRIDAAKAAAPYVHPKRAPINADGEDAAGITVIVNKP